MNVNPRLRGSIVAILGLLLFALALSPRASAQEVTAALQGTVKDTSGGTLANAAVTLTGDKLIGEKRVVTDGSGYYRFVNLPPGTYTINVRNAGFTDLKREGIELNVGRIPTIDITLSVGSEQTIVEVNTGEPQIDVTSSRTQTTVTSDEIQYAPRGQSYQSVLAFVPGARNEPLQGGFQIDGGATSENSYLVNGMETGSMVTGKSVANVPFEFIKEVQVKTGGIEAENGGALGGVVNVIAQSGTNNWHGSFFTYFQGDIMDANGANSPFNTVTNPSNPVLGTTVVNSVIQRSDPLGTYSSSARSDYAAQIYTPQKDHYRYLQPGFVIGGPIVKDRLWVFAGLAPLITTARRTVNYVNANCATTGCPGVRQFNYSEQTYLGNIRLDGAVTQKIRLFGAWQYGYDRTTGISMPNPDSVYGQYNVSTANPIDTYQGAIGSVSPTNIFTVGADVTLTPSLVATTRYGNFYQNYGDRGLPQGDRYFWANNAGAGITNIAGTSTLGTANPSAIRSLNNASIAPNLGYLYNVNSRQTFNQDLAFFKKGFFGTHNIKGGYQFQHLYENVNQTFTNDLIRLGYGTTYSPQTNFGKSQCAAIVAFNTANNGGPGGNPNGSACQGAWGYVNIRDGNEIVGKASSNNHGLYIQDNWQIAKGVTANVGVRFEKENLPSFNQYPSGINFSWTDKFAPRLGAAWDVLGNGKLKVHGSYAVFYDVMKLNLAIGSFGGNYWHDCVYALDTPDFSVVKPVKNASGHYCPTGGATVQANFASSTPAGLRFIENQDFRIPSNDPSQGAAVDPGLKPYREHESVFGADYQISRSWAFESRWTRRRLDHIIEDVGFIGENGEEFIIANPGFGTDAGGPTASCPTCKLQPKGERNYDAAEFRITKVATRHWFGQFAYTYSRLRGNYSGLTSTDIADAGGARANPNNNRAFDEPYLQFQANGQTANGLLPTDRPNSFKGIIYYRLSTFFRNDATISLFQQASSGTPLSSYADVNGAAGSYPTYVVGRGNWIDITRNASNGAWVYGNTYVKRTPWYTQSDVSLTDEYKVDDTHETWRLGFEAQFTNLLNQKAVTSVQTHINSFANTTSNYILPPGSTANSPNYGLLENGYDWKAIANSGVNPVGGTGLTLSNLYGLPVSFQQGRSIRLKAKFVF